MFVQYSALIPSMDLGPPLQSLLPLHSAISERYPCAFSRRTTRPKHMVGMRGARQIAQNTVHREQAAHFCHFRSQAENKSLKS